MTQVPDVSVVVATHDRAERLEQLLGGLRRQTLPREAFEVVVVDDASSDTTQDVLMRERERGVLRLCTPSTGERLGPASARNRGWRLAAAPLIAFTDDDCVPTPTWLETLVGAAAGHPRAIVRGRTLPNPDEADAIGPFSKTVRINGPSPHYETCNVAYPRSLLEEIGGFDESYPSPAGEDSDLGCRAVAAGGFPMFTADALVHHAVFARGPAEALGDALLATDGVRAYKRNPELREHLTLGVFYDRSHPLLLAACAGLVTHRKSLALLLCLPYARQLRTRARTLGAPAHHAGFLVVFDAVQLVAAVRGAVRHRSFVL
ncbi:MAG TPA: glycosyltransferase [Thermoleophilaceae bacterium]|nr:glycosyltransferase [Thermoleophilaceae bacterium]